MQLSSVVCDLGLSFDPVLVVASLSESTWHRWMSYPSSSGILSLLQIPRLACRTTKVH